MVCPKNKLAVFFGCDSYPFTGYGISCSPSRKNFANKMHLQRVLIPCEMKIDATDVMGLEG